MLDKERVFQDRQDSHPLDQRHIGLKDFIAEQPAPALHRAHLKGCAALRSVLVWFLCPMSALRPASYWADRGFGVG